MSDDPGTPPDVVDPPEGGEGEGEGEEHEEHEEEEEVEERTSSPEDFTPPAGDGDEEE